MPDDETPARKCVNEAKAMIHAFVTRWEKESDLKPDEIADALTDAFDEYYEVEDEISFQPEGEDEELDMGETEGGG